MKELRLAIFVAFALLFLPGAATAQYALDVKTTLGEKYEFQIAKQGVITALEKSPWSSVTETGEDYSLWLTNFRRQHKGVSLYVILDVGLRTPAMLTRGDHIDSRRVWIGYHWEKAKQYARDSVDADRFSTLIAPYCN